MTDADRVRERVAIVLWREVTVRAEPDYDFSDWDWDEEWRTLLMESERVHFRRVAAEVIDALLPLAFPSPA